MTKKGIITLIVSGYLCLFTMAGLYIYLVPFLIGCIGGKKVRKFYFRFFVK